jgi:plasmid maintenance system antidote protein VapI
VSDVVMAPIHPGEVLLEEYLSPLEIVLGKRAITADTALRLAKFFGTSERFWLNLKGRYEIELQRDRLGPILEGIQPLKSA